MESTKTVQQHCLVHEFLRSTCEVIELNAYYRVLLVIVRVTLRFEI